MLKRINSSKQRNLIEYRNREIRGEFAEFIPGLLNWVLEMDEVEAKETIKQYIKKVPSLAKMQAQTLVETNPIADWLDFNIVYEEGCRTNIGVAQRDKDPGSDKWYLNIDKWLYANYTEYCHNTGSRPIGLRRFVNLLSDVCVNQLGCLIEKGRDRHGSYFLGLKIRGKGDEDVPLFVTGLSDVTDSTGVDIGEVTDTVMDNVTIESTGDDKCDGSDGKSYSLLNVETQLELFEQYTTVIEKELIENEKVENNPSRPSREQGQDTDSDRLQANDSQTNEPSPTVTNTVTNDDDEGLKVGDKVIYVGKKNREYYGSEIMEVVKVAVHWSGNQVTCNHSRGWTTWISEGCLKKINAEKDHD